MKTYQVSNNLTKLEVKGNVKCDANGASSTWQDTKTASL